VPFFFRPRQHHLQEERPADCDGHARKSVSFKSPAMAPNIILRQVNVLKEKSVDIEGGLDGMTSFVLQSNAMPH
jgi:hypothetical protein